MHSCTHAIANTFIRAHGLAINRTPGIDKKNNSRDN